MRFNMKFLLTVITMLLAGCANDTGVSVVYDDNTTISSSSYDPYSWMYYSSSSKTPEIANPDFPSALEYEGMFKESDGVYLVMKNNTAYEMSVTLNYTISCSVNGAPTKTRTSTLSVSFNMYEKKESGYLYRTWLRENDTIECSGTIHSIIPCRYDYSNFQTWTGSYPISTK